MSAVPPAEAEPRVKTPRGCGHGEREVPVFDQEAARGLATEEIRKRWPRIWDVCLICGATTIVYASAVHYTYGDW